MAGLEADTSSYNQPLPVSPLETTKQFGGVEQQRVAIDKAKLDLMSQQFGVMNNELANLIDSGATKQQAAERLLRISKTLNLPPIATNHMMTELNEAPDVATFAKFAIRRGMDTMQKYGVQLGTPETASDQKFTYQGVRQSPEKGGGFVPATKMPVQIAPGTPGYNQQNQQVFEQPAGPPGAMPAGPVPVPRPRIGLPAERPTTGPTGPTRDITAEVPTTPANRAAPLTAGPSVMFPEGKEAYTKDQLLASGRGMTIKPAMQALKLMPGLATGPGTAQWNDLVAAAKAWGIVDTKAENDPTVLRQELEKKLAQYVGNSPIGQRSDAQQALAEAGSPNPKKQILPALQNLTRDAIALDRVNILMPNAFKGQDYQNYIKHKGNFPQTVDEKALTLDLMDDKERNSLVTKMQRDYEKGDAAAKKKATRFFETLKLAKEAKIYEE